MIEGFLHPEPDTKNSTNKGKCPKRFFTHSPPFIDRFHFIDPHECVGNDADDEKIDDHNFIDKYYI
jgi:hypothetical protein